MGGAMAFCDGVMQSNLVVSNTADNQAGGFARCDGSILNNTIYGNSSNLAAAGIYNCLGAIANCILWENKAGGVASQIGTASIPSFSCIQDWTGGGTGNINADPSLAGPNSGDYRLSPGSPCIDTGDSSLLASPGLDMDGRLRVALGGSSLSVDMGAYEYNSAAFVITEVSFLPDGNLRLTWNSQPATSYMVWWCNDLVTATWTRATKSPIPSDGAATSFAFTPSGNRVMSYRVRMMGP